MGAVLPDVWTPVPRNPVPASRVSPSMKRLGVLVVMVGLAIGCGSSQKKVVKTESVAPVMKSSSETRPAGPAMQPTTEPEPAPPVQPEPPVEPEHDCG